MTGKGGLLFHMHLLELPCLLEYLGFRKNIQCISAHVRLFLQPGSMVLFTWGDWKLLSWWVGQNGPIRSKSTPPPWAALLSVLTVLRWIHTGSASLPLVLLWQQPLDWNFEFLQDLLSLGGTGIHLRYVVLTVIHSKRRAMVPSFSFTLWERWQWRSINVMTLVYNVVGVILTLQKQRHCCQSTRNG